MLPPAAQAVVTTTPMDAALPTEPPPLPPFWVHSQPRTDFTVRKDDVESSFTHVAKWQFSCSADRWIFRWATATMLAVAVVFGVCHHYEWATVASNAHHASVSHSSRL